jgi:dsDNA-binding SOS-regulon protein
MTQAVYTILIDGKDAFTDLTEDEFCDKMMDLAQDFYESGVPHPDSVTHTVKSYG